MTCDETTCWLINDSVVDGSTSTSKSLYRIPKGLYLPLSSVHVVQLHVLLSSHLWTFVSLDSVAISLSLSLSLSDFCFSSSSFFLSVFHLSSFLPPIFSFFPPFNSTSTPPPPLSLSLSLSSFSCLFLSFFFPSFCFSLSMFFFFRLYE